MDEILAVVMIDYGSFSTLCPWFLLGKGGVTMALVS